MTEGRTTHESLDGNHTFETKDVSGYIYRPDGRETVGPNPKYSVILRHRSIQVSQKTYEELRGRKDS